MAMTASARRIGDTLKHEIDVNGRHVMFTDEPGRLGGTDEAPAPHELLPATLAACISTMIAMYAQNRGWNIGETIVDVSYDADSVPRAMTIDIQLPDDLTPDQRRRLERVADTCPVRRALEAGFTFEERIATRSIWRRRVDDGSTPVGSSPCHRPRRRSSTGTPSPEGAGPACMSIRT